MLAKVGHAAAAQRCPAASPSLLRRRRHSALCCGRWRAGRRRGSTRQLEVSAAGRAGCATALRAVPPPSLGRLRGVAAPLLRCPAFLLRLFTIYLTSTSASLSQPPHAALPVTTHACLSLSDLKPCCTRTEVRGVVVCSDVNCLGCAASLRRQGGTGVGADGQPGSRFRLRRQRRGEQRGQWRHCGRAWGVGGGGGQETERAGGMKCGAGRKSRGIKG